MAQEKSQRSSNEGMAAYRAPSLFQPHQVRRALRDAHHGLIAPMCGLYLGLSSVPTARFIAPLGFDAVWIDWEHSSCNVETMTNMVHEIAFMSEGKTVPWVRVPGHDHAAIGFALDAGASIVVPQVNTVAEAQHVVSAAKYGTASRGTRSAPPFRLIPGVTDTPINPQQTIEKNVNDQAAIMIQIETLEAIDNLDAILTQVADIDAVWLGSLDIRVSMGLPGRPTGELEPEYLAAVQKFDDTLRKHDMPRGGIAIGPDDVKRQLGKDNSINFVAADVIALLGMTADLAAAKQMFPAERKLSPVTTNGHVGKVNSNGTADRGFISHPLSNRA